MHKKYEDIQPNKDTEYKYAFCDMSLMLWMSKWL